jgi:hypothetical protein
MVRTVHALLPSSIVLSRRGEDGTLEDDTRRERWAVVCTKGSLWRTQHISLGSSRVWRHGSSGDQSILGDDHIAVTLIFHGKRLMVYVCGAETVPEGISKMPTVRVVLKDGEEKICHNAEAHIDTHNLLRMHCAENSIAEFQSEHYQYWEYVERDGETTGS